MIYYPALPGLSWFKLVFSLGKRFGLLRMERDDLIKRLEFYQIIFLI